jgi:hypothetical protein
MGRESNHVCRDTIHVNSENPLPTGAGLLLGVWQQETRKVKLEIKVREESESQSKIKKSEDKPRS